jgi:hypothetical protein
MFHVKHFWAMLDCGKKIMFNQRIILPCPAITGQLDVGMPAFGSEQSTSCAGLAAGKAAPRRGLRGIKARDAAALPPLPQAALSIPSSESLR